MRIVLDTNVLLSGLLWRGPPHTILERVRDGQLTLLCSSALLTELIDVLQRPKFDLILSRSGISPQQVLTSLQELAEIIDTPPLPGPVSRDPDDDAVLALAVFGQSDMIVSGDEDLLSLHRYRELPIVPPAEALRLVDSGTRHG